MRPKHVSVLATQEINLKHVDIDLHLTLILPVPVRRREFEI
jgi:hypothetical protein